jgi:hypothetical protein
VVQFANTALQNKADAGRRQLFESLSCTALTLPFHHAAKQAILAEEVRNAAAWG